MTRTFPWHRPTRPFVGLLFLLGGSGAFETLETWGQTPSQGQIARLCEDGRECLLEKEPAIARLGLEVEALATHLNNTPPLESEHDLLRATLRLRKLLKYCLTDQFDKFAQYRVLSPGKYDERSPWVGGLAPELEKLQAAGGQTHELKAFATALYVGGSTCTPPQPQKHDSTTPAHFWMIPLAQEKDAEALASAKIQKFLSSKDPSRKLTEVFEPSEFKAGVTHIYDIDNEWNNWTIHVTVDPNGISLGTPGSPLGQWSVPPSVVALHEMGHAARIRLGSPSESQDEAYLEELGPVLEQIIFQDEIVKSLRSQPIEQTAEYPCSPGKIGKKKIPLGQLANHFRALIQKYGGTEAAILSPEGLSWVREYF